MWLPPPKLGEHSEELVRRLGADPELLRAAGATERLMELLAARSPVADAAAPRALLAPRGIELVETTREITSQDKEVTFTLRATGDALVGNYQGIVLDLTVTDNGQAVRQLSGYGILRVDAERGVAPKK